MARDLPPTDESVGNFQTSPCGTNAGRLTRATPSADSSVRRGVDMLWTPIDASGADESLNFFVTYSVVPAPEDST